MRVSCFRAAAAGGAVLASLALANPSAAQAAAPVQRNIFSINPLGIPFEYVSAEFERMLTGLTSIGLTGSYLGWGDAAYSTLEGKLRFYPNEEGPKGFAVGLAAGVTRIAESYSNAPDRAESRPTVAVIVDYNWILGKAKRVVVGAGLGAKRVIGADGDDFSDVLVAYPTARFQIGIRF
jgi:hypothetical protein